MFRYLFLLMLLTVSPILRCAAVPRDSLMSQPKSVGLVLSGGGAKGIAHIGVIKVLEEHNIPIDYIAGTSMGAIVGGLYAAGYTPEEMMELIDSKGFSYWSTGQIDEKLIYYFYRPDPTPAMMNVNLAPGDSTRSSSILPTSLINPLPMNFAFMELFSAYTAQCGGDFDRLFVPYRCVTSDVYQKKKIVCKSGSLGDAIRASMSFPLVFQPIEMNGIPVYDGGIYDNFPVDVMRTEFAPDFMIGVDVSTPQTTPRSNDIVDQLEDMIMQKSDDSIAPAKGVKMHIDLHQFSLLDFPKARQIYKIGYDHAMAMIDSIEGRVASRVPAEERRLRRQVFKSATPYLIFDSVTVTGGTPNQNTYFERIFENTKSDTFGIDFAKYAYYRTLSGDKLKNLMPQADYNPENGLFNLRLRATVKDNLNVGFGGYITSSMNSMIFLGAGYNLLTRRPINAWLNAWVGQSYLAARASGRIFFTTNRPTSVTFDAVVSRMNTHTSDNLFYESDNPVSLSDMEAFGQLHYDWAVSRSAKMQFGGGYGYRNFGYRSRVASFEKLNLRNRSTLNSWQAFLRYERNTLDDNSYPTAGAYYFIEGAGLRSRYNYYPASELETNYKREYFSARARVNLKNYFVNTDHFSFGTELTAYYSTRKLYPTYDQSIVMAQPFHPTPSTYNSFNSNARANQFVTAGAVPVYKVNDNLQLRANLHCFMPFRAIKMNENGTARYGRWFSDPSFFGEIAAVYNFHFANLTLYGNYTESSARDWNAGISFGLFFLAPTF
ncbi:MAG: patatin-like phospholipase family protein [Muribaculaceae bacterium]|nr:patatin-like phospholipase family protein [Muribaculaceae bacterium]